MAVITCLKTFTEALDSSIYSTYLAALNCQREEGTMCDALIVCRDRQLYAHRGVLAVVSEYFRTFFGGTFCQAKREEKVLVSLEDFSSSSVQFLLDLIYQNLSEENDLEVNIFDFIQLCDFLQVHTFDSAIMEFIRVNINVETCAKYLELVNVYPMPQLKELVLIFIGSNFYNLKRSGFFRHLSCDLFSIVLRSHLLHCYSTESVIEEISLWYEQCKNEQTLKQLLSVAVKYWEVEDADHEFESILESLEIPKIGSRPKEKPVFNKLLIYCTPHSNSLPLNVFDANASRYVSLDQADSQLLRFLDSSYNSNKVHDVCYFIWNMQLYFVIIYVGVPNPRLLIASYNQCKRGIQVMAEYRLAEISWNEGLKVLSHQIVSNGVIFGLRHSSSCKILKINLNETISFEEIMTFDVEYKHWQELVFCSCCNCVFLVQENEIHIANMVTKAAKCHLYNTWLSNCIIHNNTLYGFEIVDETNTLRVYVLNKQTGIWKNFCSMVLEDVDLIITCLVYEDLVWIMCARGEVEEGLSACLLSLDLSEKKLGERKILLSSIPDAMLKVLPLPDHLLL